MPQPYFAAARPRLIRSLRDLDLGAVAVAAYVAQRIYPRISRKAEANSPLSRWARIFQRYCLRAPWRHREGSWTSLVDKGRTRGGYAPWCEQDGALYPERGRFWGEPVGEKDRPHGFIVVLYVGFYEQAFRITQRGERPESV